MPMVINGITLKSGQIWLNSLNKPRRSSCSVDVDTVRKDGRDQFLSAWLAGNLITVAFGGPFPTEADPAGLAASTGGGGAEN